LKTQIGIRVDSTLWQTYKALCEKANLRPNEPIEGFLKACVEKSDVLGVLNSLKGQSPGETMANELRLKNLLGELEGYYEADKKVGGNSNANMVNVQLEQIVALLPKIANPELLNQAKSLVEQVISYYKQAYIKISEEIARENLED